MPTKIQQIFRWGKKGQVDRQHEVTYSIMHLLTIKDDYYKGRKW